MKRQLRAFLLVVMLASMAAQPLVRPALALDPTDLDAAQAIEAAAAPVLITPLDGARATGINAPPVGVPTFRWQSVDKAVKYHIQVSTSAGFSTTVVDKDTYANSLTPDVTIPDSVYYWRVKAYADNAWGSYSDVWSFVKDWSADGQTRPQLISPPEGAQRAAFQHEDFSWTEVPGAATYRLEISTTPAFNTLSYSATTVQARHTPTERLPNSIYFWRVIPMDRRGYLGLESPTGSFTFNWNLSPALLSPLADAELPFVPRFSWTAVEAAKLYRLEISTQPDFSTSVSSYSTANTDYTPVAALSSDQDYYWRVRATDYRYYNGPWSPTWRFRIRWDYQPTLLTPLNNSTRVAYPYFSWTPVPGAERYQIQIDESTSFASPIADELIYNSTSYAQPRWPNVTVDGDVFWRVRAVDAQGNFAPWSRVFSFRPSFQTSPTQVYPPYYYAPDSASLPVYGETQLAWPVFLWDTAHIFDPFTGLTTIPDYYELAVDDDPAFGSPNLRIETSGLAAAPTLSHPFTALQDGKVYYWRVRAYRGSTQIGTDSAWLIRYNSAANAMPMATTATPIYPRAGFEAVGAPPVLGWLPVGSAQSYRVQISRDYAFTDIVDEAQPLFINYVPWQGRREAMPFGTYYWRVRPELAAAQWSEPQHFNLSLDVANGNQTDCLLPPRPSSLLGSTKSYLPSLSYVATSTGVGAGAYDLGALHVMLDRTYTGNYNWVIAFESAAGPGDSLLYGLYFDTDHEPNSGGTIDPLGKPITSDPLYLPDYVLYIVRGSGDSLRPEDAFFWRWDDTGWSAPQSLLSIGGDLWLDPERRTVQVLVPYTAVGSADPDSAGSLALTVFSTDSGPSAGIADSIPTQPGPIRRPALLSDMLLPLYPFDTDYSNPIIHYDMPTVRWRMPYFDSIDGYQVQVARDVRFTQIVETWETYESSNSPYFALLPAAFASKLAYEDNESYFWRVRIRHERYQSTFFDYGPWSPAMRLKLDSRQVGSPTLSTGELAQMTPTFTWDRVQGAGGYILQVDNDSNFSSPEIDTRVTGTSYTPTNVLRDGTYYWRVAMRRSYSVIGHWSPIMSFERQSVWPLLVGPVNDAALSGQPALQWTAVLTPTNTPRLAASRYRLQLAADPSFSSPKTYDTDSTSYDPRKGQSLPDGSHYWRVAVVDASLVAGTFSPAQRFYKQYPAPELLAPAQNTRVGGIPSFEWSPLPGAASYRIQTADNEQFNTAVTVTTDATRYTPLTKIARGHCYWRVQMLDADNNPGPYSSGYVYLGVSQYLPVILD